MGKKLVIAEKPMLAKAILDAIPGTAKSIKAGERVFYTEKGDYLVVALAGHVLQLKEPEDYDPKYKKWTLEDLPIFFPDWAAVPAQGKGNIVKCVKSLLPQADSVIHAGDVDDEGQLIVDELLRYCGYRGKVQRLYTSDTCGTSCHNEVRSANEFGACESDGRDDACVLWGSRRRSPETGAAAQRGVFCRDAAASAVLYLCLQRAEDLLQARRGCARR